MSTTDKTLPDWWQREKQRRQLHLLVLLGLLIALIFFFYHVAHTGVNGFNGGAIDFDTSNTIAFIRQDGSGPVTLYDIRADGTNLKPLTPSDDISDKSAPAWSLDGKQLYYASSRDDHKKMQIYIISAGDIKQVTHGAVRKESPISTPDGKRVAYIAAGAVRSILPNGNDVDQILPPPRVEGKSGEENNAAPELNGPYLSVSFIADGSFSPDGSGSVGIKELSTENIFSDPQLEGLAGGDQVAEVVPPGTTRALPLDAGSAVNAVWEPGGSRLLVAYAESPRAIDDKGTRGLISGVSLYSFDKAGKPGGVPLLINIGQGSQPRNIDWAAGSKKIAFEAWTLKGEKERSLTGIIVMRLPDKPLRISPEDMTPYQAVLIPATPQAQPHLPRWSPDGSRLLYQVTREDGKNDLWVVNSDLTNPINLTKGKGDNTQAAWSPARPK